MMNSPSLEGTDMLTHISVLLFALEVARGAIIAPRAQIIGRKAVLKTSYDFVIIGGGTSGLTVADRLTENPRSKWLIFAFLQQPKQKLICSLEIATVLVIEYGPLDNH